MSADSEKESISAEPNLDFEAEIPVEDHPDLLNSDAESDASASSSSSGSGSESSNMSF